MDEQYIELGYHEVFDLARMGICPKELLVWAYVRHYTVKEAKDPGVREKIFGVMEGHCPVSLTREEFNYCMDYIERAHQIHPR